MYVVQNDLVDTVIGPPDYIDMSSTRVGKTCKKRSLRCRVRTTTESVQRIPAFEFGILAAA